MTTKQPAICKFFRAPFRYRILSCPASVLGLRGHSFKIIELKEKYQAIASDKYIVTWECSRCGTIKKQEVDQETYQNYRLDKVNIYHPSQGKVITG